MSLTLDDRVKELDSRSRGIAFRRMIKGKSVWITLGTYLEQKKEYPILEYLIKLQVIYEKIILHNCYPKKL